MSAVLAFSSASASAGRWQHDARRAALLEAIAEDDEHRPATLEEVLISSSAAPIATLAGSGAHVTDLSGDVGAGASLLRAAIEALGAAPAHVSCRRLLYVPGILSARLPCEASFARLLRDCADRGRHDVLVVASGVGVPAYRLVRFEALMDAVGWQHVQLWVDWGATFAIHVLEQG